MDNSDVKPTVPKSTPRLLKGQGISKLHLKLYAGARTQESNKSSGGIGAY